MAAKFAKQDNAPYLSQHSADPSWPLRVVVDSRGASRHACANCGAEIPDGVAVEVLPGGKVRAVTYRSQMSTNPGQPVGPPEVETTHHTCP